MRPAPMRSPTLPRFALLALCLAASAVPATAFGSSDEFLSRFDLSGYVQGRFTGQLTTTDTPAGALNTLTPPDRAGGESQTQALLKRLEFNLNTQLPWEGWSLKTTTAVNGSQTAFKDIYAAYRPDRTWQAKFGRFRVPFGLDPQSSSREMDTVERPLIYSLGNFGWVAPLGFDFVGDRDYGIRLDWTPPAGFANFAPSLETAWVCGNGHDVVLKPGSQIMARLAVANLVRFEELRNDVIAGASFSYGANRFSPRTEAYLPIGLPGDLEQTPERAVQAEDLGSRGEVMVMGVDVALRMNNLVLKSEALTRRVNGFDAQGYYATAIIELGSFGLPLDLVGRWEEAIQGYADGAHLPNVWYQVITAGLTWHPGKDWRIQANYLTVRLNDVPHGFPGSDLGILQVQWGF